MDVVRLSVELTAQVRMNIRPDYKISGKVEDLKTNITDFKTFFFSYATIESLTTELDMLDYWAISYMNNLLDQGLELPLPEWIIGPMTKPRFKQYNGYWPFDSEPKTQTTLDQAAPADIFL